MSHPFANGPYHSGHLGGLDLHSLGIMAGYTGAAESDRLATSLGDHRLLAGQEQRQAYEDSLPNPEFDAFIKDLSWEARTQYQAHRREVINLLQNMPQVFDPVASENVWVLRALRDRFPFSRIIGYPAFIPLIKEFYEVGQSSALGAGFYRRWVKEAYPDWVQRLFARRLPHQQEELAGYVLTELTMKGVFLPSTNPEFPTSIAGRFQAAGVSLACTFETKQGRLVWKAFVEEPADLLLPLFRLLA